MSRAVITGAARGLGRALTLGYLERGWDVWAGCRNPDQAADLGARVRRLDVADEGLVLEFAAGIGGGVDVVINAAGTDARAFGAATDRRGPFELSADHMVAELRVNAVGPMLVTRALRPQLTAAHGKVVNLSSRVASMNVGAELCWDIGYNASKAALNAVTVRTAELLKDSGVIVVAMHPGWVRTDMGGPEADLTPRDAADQIIETIDKLGPEDNGMFLRADGTSHPW